MLATIIFFDTLNFKQDCNIAVIIVELMLFFIRLIFKNWNTLIDLSKIF